MLAYADRTEYGNREILGGEHTLKAHVARDIVVRGLLRERVWRQPEDAGDRMTPVTDILASRWLDLSEARRQADADAPPDRHVISVALAMTRLRLSRGSIEVFNGTVPAGMLHVTGPSQRLTAEFRAPCDFVHFYVANDYLKQRQAEAALSEIGQPDRNLADLMVRDPLVEQLSRTLVDGSYSGDELYAKSIGQTIVTRLVALRPRALSVSPLASWRLRRVQGHIDDNIAESVTLVALAAAAGLSPMHFAAQFRAATGCRPHEYLLQRRVGYAKTLLAQGKLPLVEIALNAGFQTQSHFSTVFKRLTGESPARWRRYNLSNTP